MNDHKADKHEEGVVLPKLLTDHPGTADAFGAHTAIAKSLADLVLKDQEGRCVALQGSWGSGKSTVIGILTEKLGDKADIFMFDTWSNQGDPLRFSFMGAFVDWILHKFKDLEVDAKGWKKDVDENARSTVKEVPEEPKVKPPLMQWLTALLLVALPVGLALASEEWQEVLGAGLARYVYFFGLFLVLSPFLYVGFLWKVYNLNLFTEIATAIERAAEDTKRIVVRRGPLATSLEFTQKVHVYCEALHKRDPKRKLLIIFDNIDRVAERNSPKVWSLLTALLEVVHNKHAPYKSNVWVLVPVDLDTIPIPLSVGRALVTEAEDGTPDGVTEDDLKLEFIEKTFQLNMVVPPPLSVATERYFKDQFDLAFTGTPVENDWYECYAVLREARGSAQAFTPRAIKRFINDVVGLWRARHHLDPENMPSVALMTLYLCERDRIHHPDDVGNGIITGATAPHIPDANPTATLAAIAFGDKTSAGLQILVGARVDAALKSGDPKEIDDLSDADGFAEAFASYVRAHHSWLYSDLALMARVYRLIGYLKVEVRTKVANRISGTTKSVVQASAITGQIDKNSAEGFAEAQLLGGASEAQFQQRLQLLLDTLVALKAADLGEAWFGCAAVYIKALNDKGVQYTKIKIALPDGDGIALSILQTDIRRLYVGDKVAFSIKPEVVKTIEGMITQGATNFTLDALSIVTAQTLRKIAPGFTTAQACSAMNQRLLNNGSIPTETLAAAITLIDDTLRNEDAAPLKELVTQWMRNGYLYHHYQVTQGDKSNLMMRMVALEAAIPFQNTQIGNWNQSPPGRQNISNESNALEGNRLVQAVDYFIRARRFRAIVRNAQVLGREPLRRSMLLNMLERKLKLYTPETYCTELAALNDSLPEDLREALIRYAVETLRVDEYLIKHDTAEAQITFTNYERIGRAIIESDRKLNYYTRLSQLLGAQPHEWWKTTVKASDPTLRVLAGTITEVLGPGWLKSDDARQVIGDFVLGGAFVGDENREAYTLALFKALSPDERRIILLQVKNKAMVQGDLTEFGRFQRLSEFMFEDREVLEDVNKIVISILVPAVEQDPANRDIVTKMVDRYGLKEKVSGEAKKRLAEGLAPPVPPAPPAKS
jgi:KAP-like P-loop domain-containing protein